MLRTKPGLGTGRLTGPVNKQVRLLGESRPQVQGIPGREASPGRGEGRADLEEEELSGDAHGIRHPSEIGKEMRTSFRMKESWACVQAEGEKPGREQEGGKVPDSGCRLPGQVSGEGRGETPRSVQKGCGGGGTAKVFKCETRPVSPAQSRQSGSEHESSPRRTRWSHRAGQCP